MAHSKIEKDIKTLKKYTCYLGDDDDDGYSARNTLGNLIIIDKLTELSTAFNAQTKVMERQNELQEQANLLQEKTLAALEAITNNTAPKVKHVKNDPKHKKVVL